MSYKNRGCDGDGYDNVSIEPLELDGISRNRKSNLYDASTALKSFHDVLTDFERTEILQYKEIYYVGCSNRKHPDLLNRPLSDRHHKNRSVKNGDSNLTFDDAENYYRIIKNDHVAYRFEILSLLGKGSFGSVVSAYDHKYKQNIALKIIRTEPRFNQQAKQEIKILELIKTLRGQQQGDDVSKFPLVQLGEHFTFRNHICMTFELLSVNLYDLLKQYKFCGLPRHRVLRISYQILEALSYIERAGIIHCDLKPENVLLVWSSTPNGSSGHQQSRQQTSDRVKLIDFGSSCMRGQSVFSYIQSRFYRAPEVILRLGYGTPIDMWSFGCLVAELINGLPLFPGEDEPDQMACIMTVKGLPPSSMLQKSSERKRFFTPLAQQQVTTASPHNSQQLQDCSVQLESGSLYLPKYLVLDYANSTNPPLPLIKPGRSRSGKLERTFPGRCSLLQSLIFSRIANFKIKNTNKQEAYQAELDRASQTSDNRLLVELLDQCLTWLPKQRLVPDKALQHAWFTSLNQQRTGEPHILQPLDLSRQQSSVDSSARDHKSVSARLLPHHWQNNHLPGAPSNGNSVKSSRQGMRAVDRRSATGSTQIKLIHNSDHSNNATPRYYSARTSNVSFDQVNFPSRPSPHSNSLSRPLTTDRDFLNPSRPNSKQSRLIVLTDARDRQFSEYTGNQHVNSIGNLSTSSSMSRRESATDPTVAALQQSDLCNTTPIYSHFDSSATPVNSRAPVRLSTFTSPRIGPQLSSDRPSQDHVTTSARLSNHHHRGSTNRDLLPNQLIPSRYKQVLTTEPTIQQSLTNEVDRRRAPIDYPSLTGDGNRLRTIPTKINDRKLNHVSVNLDPATGVSIYSNRSFAQSVPDIHNSANKH